jgi:isoquinoline 1-oxidoreductase alpha subunit
MIDFTLNGEAVSLDVPPEMPLLWALRESAGLTGTKFSCGIGNCGACTVHLDGAAVRSCSVPVANVAGRAVTTIEGLADGEALHPLQQAWIDHQVPQCGYCQPGMLMAISALLERRPDVTDEQVTESITNICRCGTYERIRSAVQSVIQKTDEDLDEENGNV